MEEQEIIEGDNQGNYASPWVFHLKTLWKYSYALNKSCKLLELTTLILMKSEGL